MAEEILPTQEMQKNPFERAMEKAAEVKKVDQERATRMEILQEVKQVAAEDDGPSFWKEAGKAVWGAGVDPLIELGVMFTEFAASASYMDQANVRAYAEAEGLDYATAQEQLMSEVNAIQENVSGGIRDFGDTIAPENETGIGSGARSIGQFLVPYLNISKAVGGIKTLKGAAAAGVAIDFSMFDPNEGNLSNLLGELSPDLKDSALTFLATDPNDSAALNRLKNAVEGGIIGGTVDGLMQVFKMARHAINMRKIKGAYDEADNISTTLMSADEIQAEKQANAAAAEATPEVKPDDIPEAPLAAADEVTPEVKPADAPEVQPKDTPEAPVQAADEVTPEVQPKDAPEAAKLQDAPLEPKERSQSVFRKTVRDSIEMTPEAVARLNKALFEGDEEGLSRIIQTDFNSSRIDWENIDNAQDIKDLLNVTSEVFAEQIDKVKGGVQSHQHTKQLANLTGGTVESVHNMFKDITGENGIAARMVGAKQVMISAFQEMDRLYKLAKADPNNVNHRIAWLKQTHLVGGLQAEIKGAQTEVARTLSAMRIITTEAATGFREFNVDLRNVTAGTDIKGGRDFERMMDETMDGRSLEEITAKVREMTKYEKIDSIISEYVINSMLSGPATHAMNMTSNAFNAIIYSGDRVLAGFFRAATSRGKDLKGLREAKIDIIRKFTAISDAGRLAVQALKEGAPITDKRQRLELQTRKAITSENKGVWGKIVNATGEVVRVPARFLVAGDEFFKTIVNRSEIAVQSYRAADELAEKAGLQVGTKDYETFMDAKMAELSDPENMSVAARDVRTASIAQARLVTFQEIPRTELGPAVEKMLNWNVYFKLAVAPFFRTPANIVRQGIVDRTPLAFLLKDVQETMVKGTRAEKAEIAARASSAIVTLGAVVPFILPDSDGKPRIVGKLPYDSTMKAEGIKDYSFRLGDDTWVQFNRLDPAGMWLGMAADLITYLNAGYEEGDEISSSLLQGLVFGFVSNIFDKTWTRGLADTISTLDTISTGNADTAKRAGAQFAASNVGKLIPRIASVTYDLAVEPDEKVALEAWTFTDRLAKATPFFGGDLSPKHDFLGRVITTKNTAASRLLPIPVSGEDPTVLEQELFRLNMTIRAMPKSINSGTVKLDAASYSKLTGLVGTVDVDRGKNLEETLEALIASEKYQGWNDTRRAFEVRDRIDAARKMAKFQFMNDPELLDEYKESKKAEIQALMAPRSN